LGKFEQNNYEKFEKGSKCRFPVIFFIIIHFLLAIIYIIFLKKNVFRLGPLEIEHRVVKRAPIAKEKREVKELKQTKRLTEADIQKNENETPKNVMAINRCLEEQGFFFFFFHLFFSLSLKISFLFPLISK